MYLELLKEIQGIYILKLLNYKILHKAFIFIFTLLIGELFADTNNISKEKKQLAINDLLVIYTREVKHRNIRLEKIILKRNKSTGCSYAW